MTLQTVFGVLVVLYSVANLASMGLELNLRETIKSLRSARLVILTLVWGWVVGPAFAVLLTKVLPLAEPYAIGLLIFSLAPIAPFLPILVRKARADMDFSAALMPLAMVATVVLLPLMAPWLIKGLTVNAWSSGQTASPAGPAAAGGVRRDQGLRRAGGGQALPRGQAARGDLHAADPRVHAWCSTSGISSAHWAALPSARKSSSSSGSRSCPISSASA